MTERESRYDVSVIIPTYNQSKLLGNTLMSLYKQDIGGDKFEVIIADDGSSDDTKDVVRKFESLMNLKYVFQEDQGYRPASARNKGIRVAEGDICLLIDSSIILNTNCIGEHILFYEKKGHDAAVIGYVYGFHQEPESEELVRELVVPEDPFDSVRKLAGFSRFADPRESQYATHQYRIESLPAPWVFFWTCHVSARRTDLLNIGLFDENYDGRWGMEDYDLGFRLHQAGVGLFLLRSAESIHYPHPKDMTERKVQGFQNCAYFNNKFRTFETDLYYRNYHHIEGIDVNAICLEQSNGR